MQSSLFNHLTNEQRARVWPFQGNSPLKERIRPTDHPLLMRLWFDAPEAVRREFRDDHQAFYVWADREAHRLIESAHA